MPSRRACLPLPSESAIVDAREVDSHSLCAFAVPAWRGKKHASVADARIRGDRGQTPQRHPMWPRGQRDRVHCCRVRRPGAVRSRILPQRKRRSKKPTNAPYPGYGGVGVQIIAAVVRRQTLLFDRKRSGDHGGRACGRDRSTGSTTSPASDSVVGRRGKLNAVPPPTGKFTGVPGGVAGGRRASPDGMVRLRLGHHSPGGSRGPTFPKGRRSNLAGISGGAASSQGGLSHRLGLLGRSLEVASGVAAG